MTRATTALALACMALFACRGDTSTPTGPTITVTAYAGSGMDTAGGLTVLVTNNDGSVLDDQQTDGDGEAEVQSVAGSLISVLFTMQDDPNGPDDATPISIVTTAAPATSTLAVHGPAAPMVSVVVGGLMVAPQTPLTADSYDIDLGCALTTVTSLPASVDVASICLGTDPNIDVLVRAYTGSGGSGAARTLVGYAAGRVLLDDSNQNQIAQFTPATWSTTTTSVPITVDPSITPTLDWTLFVDTLPFDPGLALTGSGALWDGLMVDHVTFDATIADPAGTGGAVVTQTSHQFVTGVPTTLAVAPSDFLGPIGGPLTVMARSPLVVAWTATPPDNADLVHCRVSWMSAQPIVWDIVLPPDAAQIAFPQLDSTLGQLIGTPGADPTSAPIATALRYLDSSDYAGFGDAQAAGIFAIDTDNPSPIVPDPTMGEVRVSGATLQQ